MRENLLSNYKAYFITALFLIPISLLIGNRDLSVGTDTATYARSYMKIVDCLCFSKHEIGYEILSILAAVVGLSTAGFFSLISGVIFLIPLLALALSNSNGQQNKISLTALFLAYSFYLLNPIIVQTHINAIRQGLSAALLLLGTVLLVENRRAAYIIISISALFHLSAFLYIPFLLILLIVRGKNLLLLSFLLFTILFSLYSLGISEEIIEYASPSLYEFVSLYGYTPYTSYKHGVRLDFSIFTYFVGLLLMFFSLFIKNNSKKALTFTSIYMLFSIPFFLLGWGVYSNRYLFTPWFISSFLMSYYVMSFRWSFGFMALSFPIFLVGIMYTLSKAT